MGEPGGEEQDLTRLRADANLPLAAGAVLIASGAAAGIGILMVVSCFF